MTEESADLLRRCRIGLVGHAKANRREMSAAEWEEMAAQSDAGKVVGLREVEAVCRLVWGIGCSPMRWR